MNYPEALGLLIAGARSGNEIFLADLRSLVTAQGDRGQIFEVREEKVLHDTLALGPRLRREVFAPLKPFASSVPRLAGLSVDVAIDQVRACPPLAKVLQARALAQVCTLERRLIVDETLDARGRAKINKELKLLNAAGRASWENWISLTPAGMHYQFDIIVRRWLGEPVDLAEQQWFIPNWRAQPYSRASALDFFKRMAFELRLFFDITLSDAADARAPQRHARLDTPIEEANFRAELLGVRFRFQAASPSPTASPRPA